MNPPDDVKRSAEMLAALAEPTRILILQELVRGPKHVGEMAEQLGVPMVNMSHHLGVMRNAGILDNAKDGRKVVYSLRPDVFTPGDGKQTLGALRLGSFLLALDARGKGKPGGRSR